MIFKMAPEIRKKKEREREREKIFMKYERDNKMKSTVFPPKKKNDNVNDNNNNLFYRKAFGYAVQTKF